MRQYYRPICFVGTGAIIIKDEPDYALVVRNPAKIIGWICECGHRLTFYENAANCSECEKQYIKNNDEVSFVNDKELIEKLRVAR
jgi:UDP-2-acetamido-3-amino-2,3-dideoxy-glucuronate N-acetyltransferase